MNKLLRFWNEPPKNKFLNGKEILCLGSASLGVSFISNIIGMYVTITRLPILYNMGSFGTMHATIIYIVAFLLGLILTPVYGRMVQRTNSKFGRYKPYILFMAPIVSILGIAALWSPGGLDQTSRIIYVYMLSIPTILTWNLWSNAFNMFPGVFTPNQQERVDIWAPIGLVMGFAPSIMNVLKDVFAGIWGDVVAARIFGVTSAVVGMVFIIGLVKVKERVFVTVQENKANKISIFQGLKMVSKNKPLLILTLALIFGCLKGAIDLSWDIICRVKYAANMADAAKMIGALSMVVGFAATPNMILLPWLTRKFNNRTIMVAWQAFNTCAYLVLAIIGFQRFEQGTASAFILTALRFVAAFNAMGSLQPLMISEIGDYQQRISGYRLEGFIQTVVYSLTTFITQLALLVPAFLQGVIGINPNDYIVTEGIGGIPTNEMPENILSADLINKVDRYANIIIWISVASGALMLICLLFYNLDKKKHAKIIEELKNESINTSDIESEKGNLVIFGANNDENAVKDGENGGVNADDETNSIDARSDDPENDGINDGDRKP